MIGIFSYFMQYCPDKLLIAATTLYLNFDTPCPLKTFTPGFLKIR